MGFRELFRLNGVPLMKPEGDANFAVRVLRSFRDAAGGIAEDEWTELTKRVAMALEDIKHRAQSSPDLLDLTWFDAFRQALQR